MTELEGVSDQEVDRLLAEYDMVVRKAQRAVVFDAARTFAGDDTLTAAVSLGSLLRIPREWAKRVQTDIMPALLGLFRYGSATVQAEVPDVFQVPVVEPELSGVLDRVNEYGVRLWTEAKDKAEQGGSSAELAVKVREVASFTPLSVLTEGKNALFAGEFAQTQAIARDLDIPVTKRWQSEEDERVRLSHMEADGQSVGLDDFFRVGTALLMFPCDMNGPNNEIINCRCRVKYDLEFDGIEESGLTAAFVEAEHPRRNDGKFKKKGASDGPSTQVDQKPRKLTHHLLLAKHAPGTVIAESSDGQKRIRWNGKKYEAQTKSGNEWRLNSVVNKTAAYKTFNDGTSWVDPPGDAPATEKLAAGNKTGTPVKITHILIQTKHADGAVIAQSADEKQRIVWDGSAKRYQVQRKVEGQWTTEQSLLKSKAYKEIDRGVDWRTPSAPNTEPSGSTLKDVSPAPTITTRLDPEPVSSVDDDLNVGPSPEDIKRVNTKYDTLLDERPELASELKIIKAQYQKGLMLHSEFENEIDKLANKVKLHLDKNGNSSGNEILTEKNMTPLQYKTNMEPNWEGIPEEFRENALGWTENTEMSNDQSAALLTYSGGDFVHINEYLRSGNVGGNFTESSMKEITENISDAMYPMPENVKVNRLTGHFPPFTSRDIYKLKAGTKFQTKGFVSTSISTNVDTGGSNDLQLDIEVTKGTHGTYMEEHSHFPHEYEMLLDNGTEFELVSIEEFSGQYPRYKIKLRTIPSEQED